MTAVPPALRRWHDPASTALIPLRPLSTGEVMDAAFLIVRRNAGSMLGLPVLFMAVMTAAGASNALVSALVADDTAQLLLLMLTLSVTSVLVMVLSVWCTTMLCHAALRTLMGAPEEPGAGWRTTARLVPGSLVVAVMIAVFGVAVSAVIQVGLAVLTLLVMTVSTELVVALWLLVPILFAWASAFVTPAVPAYVAEGAHAPDWAGRPRVRTSAFSAVFRSMNMVGWRGSLRVATVVAAAWLGAVVVTLLLSLGVVIVVLLYAGGLGVGLTPSELLTASYVAVLVSALPCLALFQAFWAALQVVVYLDCRMRREGLDLGMRFAALPMPQPNMQVVD